jgi:SpoVK/Ycf46/Vps4 family AAA+-type ATPase
VPDCEQIKEILKKNLSTVKYSISASDFDQAARQLDGYSASDVVSLVKEAVMLPLRQQQNILKMSLQEIPAVKLTHLLQAKKTVFPCASYEEILKLRNWCKDS